MSVKIHMDEVWDALKRWKKERQERGAWTTHDENVMLLVSCRLAEPKEPAPQIIPGAQEGPQDAPGATE
jgi:hypothetical protein